MEWPRWATTRAEEVKKQIPAGQRGPWDRAEGICVAPDTGHDHHEGGPEPAAENAFFLCAAHLAEARRRQELKPWPTRDQGWCIACGRPARRRTRAEPDVAACMRAERANSTVARMMTEEHCEECSARKKRWCRGPSCADGQDPRSVLPQGCCELTRESRSRHCGRCCEAGQVTPPANRKTRAERRQDRLQVARLRREGLAYRQIGAHLQLPPNTVREYDRANRRQMEAALRARRQDYEDRRGRIRSLKEAGHDVPEISRQTGLARRTVRRALDDRPASG